jgi:flavin reductase (DIM6/NTAB) family NADH-FMN oxidoreductase RutF
MDADRPANGQILSLFSTPLTAIGCSDDDGPNAQISVSTYGAGVVPDQPRLITALYKANRTHDLVLAKGSFSLSVLSEQQIDLIPALGFVSSSDGAKLGGLAYHLTPLGNPVFEGSLGWLEAEVIEAFDMGDGTAFLSAVLQHERLTEDTPLYWSRLLPQLPTEWQQQWFQKIARDIDRYRPMMRWLPRD